MEGNDERWRDKTATRKIKKKKFLFLVSSSYIVVRCWVFFFSSAYLDFCFKTWWSNIKPNGSFVVSFIILSARFKKFEWVLGLYRTQIQQTAQIQRYIQPFSRFLFVFHISFGISLIFRAHHNRNTIWTYIVCLVRTNNVHAAGNFVSFTALLNSTRHRLLLPVSFDFPHTS